MLCWVAIVRSSSCNDGDPSNTTECREDQQPQPQLQPQPQQQQQQQQAQQQQGAGYAPLRLFCNACLVGTPYLSCSVLPQCPAADISLQSRANEGGSESSDEDSDVDLAVFQDSDEDVHDGV